MRAIAASVYAQAATLLMLAYVLLMDYLFFRLPRDAGQELDCKELQDDSVLVS